MNVENAGNNILSKIDRSLTPVPGRVSAIKREKYDWSTGGSRGEFHWVDKHDLNIDGRYQRDQCSEDKVRTIARGWDWLILGVLSVIRREDGSLWVFDGGHRARASFLRDDVESLPCMVHEVGSVNAEAKAFVARNTMVSTVSSRDRYKASVVAGEPCAEQAAALLAEHGLELSLRSGSGKILCIGALQQCVNDDYDNASKTLGLCVKIAGDASVSGNILKAVFTLQKHFLPAVDIIATYQDRLLGHSQRELEIKINQFSAECGGKKGSVIGAKALLQVINHKLKTRRLEW